MLYDRQRWASPVSRFEPTGPSPIRNRRGPARATGSQTPTTPPNQQRIIFHVRGHPNHHFEAENEVDRRLERVAVRVPQVRDAELRDSTYGNPGGVPRVRREERLAGE